MRDIHLLEKLEQAGLSLPQQGHLFALITDVFKQAIDARAPKNRPPGKAGLRAEKGYYRLLYLEGDFQEKVSLHATTQSEIPAFNWDFLPVILRQFKDIPELQQEIREGIESALMELTGTRPDG